MREYVSRLVLLSMVAFYSDSAPGPPSGTLPLAWTLLRDFALGPPSGTIPLSTPQGLCPGPLRGSALDPSPKPTHSLR